MDSKTSAKISSLQQELKELELKESNLKNELNEVKGKIQLVNKELASITKNDDKITTEILELVYAQRRKK